MNQPIADKRKIEDLVHEFIEKSRVYSPEWRFSEEQRDAGYALAKIFIEMHYETIQRYNLSLYKNYLEFLNTIGVKNKHAIPARGHVVFKLSNGSNANVYIDSGTQVYADSFNEDVEKIVYETEYGFYAVPASIKTILNVDPFNERIVKIFDSEEEPSKMIFYDTEYKANLQEHTFYLKNDYILESKSKTFFKINFINSKQYMNNDILEFLSDNRSVEWRYFNGQKWSEFKGIHIEGDNLILEKSAEDSIELTSIEDINGRWISCSVKEGCENYKNISVNGIKMCAAMGSLTSALEPEYVFYNDIQLNENKGYCFGKSPNVYDCFYISSSEVFTKKGALVDIDISLGFIDIKTEEIIIEQKKSFKLIMEKEKPKEEKRIAISEVIWEYWNGNGWARLPMDKISSDAFYGGEKNKINISFYVPMDLKKILVNFYEGYFIRARIIEIENNYVINGYHSLPYLKNIGLKYKYETLPDIEAIVLKNNMKTEKMEKLVFDSSQRLDLFKYLEDVDSAVYFCFDKAPNGLPINLYFRISGYANETIPNIIYEYYSGVEGDLGWKEIKHKDFTDNYSHSGIVSLVANGNFKNARFFNEEGYFIRAVQRLRKGTKKELLKPVVEGVYLNAASIVQKETAEKELHYVEKFDVNKVVDLLKSPIVEATVWVNEYSYLTTEEMLEFKVSKSDFVREEFDEIGRVIKFWVKWSEVKEFYNSDEDQRCYKLDNTKGKVFFGDGTMGKIPSYQEDESIIVEYSVGGGVIGNIDAQSIKGALKPIAYLDKVYNIESICGGSDIQNIDIIAQVGPQVLKHKNRAVSKEDFSNIILQEFTDVAKVSCYKVRGAIGKKAHGRLCLVVMPRDYYNDLYAIQLCERVKEYIHSVCDSMLTLDNRIRVIPPLKIYINVSITIEVSNFDKIGNIEKDISDIVSDFLNPLNGAGGKGWRIGDLPEEDVFYGLIKGVHGVEYVKGVTLEGYYYEGSNKKYVIIDYKTNIPEAIILPGDIRVII